jgi:hypothetical protein
MLCWTNINFTYRERESCLYYTVLSYVDELVVFVVFIYRMYVLYCVSFFLSVTDVMSDFQM